MSTVINGSSVTTDTINYDTAKDEAGVFTKQQVVQVVNVTDGAVATGTTIIPVDNTIPQQSTEGTEFMTLAITPKSASNILVIDVVVLGGCATAGRTACAALFQDTTENAISASRVFQTTLNGGSFASFKHYMVAGTTSATTFKVRCGVDTSGTYTFNGVAGVVHYGAISKSSITITEYTP